MLRRVFSTPGRQAAAWSSIGVLGFGLAALGLFLYNREPDARAVSPPTTAIARAAETSTPTAAPSATPTASPTATAAPATPTTPAQAPRAQEAAAPATSPPEVTRTPTTSPVVAGGPYCDAISRDTPPNSVIGLFRSAGQPVPAGASVGLAFDGVPGPTTVTAAAGGYRVDYGAAGADCANRVGAAISVAYSGQTYPTGHTVGDSPGGPARFDLDIP